MGVAFTCHRAGEVDLAMTHGMATSGGPEPIMIYREGLGNNDRQGEAVEEDEDECS